MVTIGSLWEQLVEARRIDDVLHWPPDLFALVERVLDASEAYRLVISPPPGVAVTGVSAGSAATAAEWWEWLDGTRESAPESLLAWWKIVKDAGEVGLDLLGSGGEWPVTEALIALHAVADEACAGLGTSTAVKPGAGCRFRAEARELLAETGSLSRIERGVLRVLPRCRVSLGGISIHSLARHVCVRGPQVDVDWHRMISRPTGVTYPEAHANILLLPWPLRVRARDFRPVHFSLPLMDPTEFGFFAFDPAERLDLDLVDRILVAAIDEAGTADVVFLPEAAITPADIEPLERLLGSYGVWFLIAGVREAPTEDRLGENWVHVGIRQEIVWRHAKQHKHHRWGLDERQIKQYHLGGALTPTMHWWEAVSVPRRSLQVIDQGAVTIVPLVCEDLARLEPVADLVRAIGPSLVLSVLLDGPQLASRWTARYASVLADDPGSAVCTLTSFGMVERCRPPGCETSRVVALWKDATGELTEIPLEEGAEAILISTHPSIGGCITADGRRHPATTSTLTLAAVHSIRSIGAEHPPTDDATPCSAPPLTVAGAKTAQVDERDLSKATSWAEAIVEAVVSGTVSVDALMTEATNADRRAALGLPTPPLLQDGIEALRRELPPEPSIEQLWAATRRMRTSDEPTSIVAATLLQIAIEQRLFAEVLAGRLPPQAFAVLET